MNSASITKIYCPHCGRCIAMRHIKNKRAVSRTLCKQPANEKDDDMISWHARIAGMEQRIDDMTDEYRNNMFARIQQGTCSDEGSILFSEMLTDFERIGDHARNISDEMMKIAMIE